jgi:hypothetical protein
MRKNTQWQRNIGCGRLATAPILTIGLALFIVFFTGGLFVPSAYAQTQAPLLDQYIPPTAGGGGGFQSVLTRYQPEYASSGIPLGNFIIRPALNETTGYDSNVFATSQARGSPIIETNASLGASSDWSVDRLQLALSVDDVRYPSQPALSNTNWNATIGGSHNFGQDVGTATYSHQAQTLLPTSLDVPQLSVAVPYTVDDFQASYRINLAKSYILPSIDVTSFTLGNNTSTYTAASFNRIVVSPTLTLGYELAAQRDLVVVLRDSNANYTAQPTPGTARPNYNDVALLSGLDYGANGVIRFRFLVGYELRSFQYSQEYKNISAPIAEASAIWTPTGLTAVTATASRTIQASANGATASYTQNYVQFRVDHEYLPNVLLRADAGIYFDDYPGSLGNQTLYTVGAGVTYLLNRNIRLVFGYDFTARQSSISNTNAATFGSNYTDHRATLQLRLSL